MREKYVKNLNKEYTFSKDGFHVTLPSIQNNDVSICFVDINGERTSYCMLDRSTIFYYVLEGSGQCEIGSDKVKVQKDDLVEILSGQKYSYLGNMKLLEIQSNGFDESEVHEFKKEMK